jgi:hypothetical protein
MLKTANFTYLGLLIVMSRLRALIVILAINLLNICNIFNLSQIISNRYYLSL